MSFALKYEDYFSDFLMNYVNPLLQLYEMENGNNNQLRDIYKL